jgi:hypothetical protein
MGDSPIVGTWVSVPDECEMSFTVNAEDATSLMVGTGVELVLTNHGLDRLIETATSARDLRVSGG